MFSKVESRTGLDSVRAMSQVDLVRVQFEDLLFGEVLLDLNGQKRLIDFPPPLFLGRQEELLGELLGERGGTFNLAPRHEVLDPSAKDGAGIDATVLIEAGVFGRDDGVVKEL